MNIFTEKDMILGDDVHIKKKKNDNDIFEYTIHKYGNENGWVFGKIGITNNNLKRTY